MQNNTVDYSYPELNNRIIDLLNIENNVDTFNDPEQVWYVLQDLHKINPFNRIELEQIFIKSVIQQNEYIMDFVVQNYGQGPEDEDKFNLFTGLLAKPYGQHQAARTIDQRLTIVDYLIQRGQTDALRNLLDYVSGKNASLINSMVNGISRHFPADSKTTYLMYTIIEGLYDSAKVLIEYGADLEAVDSTGENAIDIFYSMDEPDEDKKQISAFRWIVEKFNTVKKQKEQMNVEPAEIIDAEFEHVPAQQEEQQAPTREQFLEAIKTVEKYLQSI